MTRYNQNPNFYNGFNPCMSVLHSLIIVFKQMENFINMWNNDGEFRNYYARCNTMSTFIRLGTLDGRSHSPYEEPPWITYATRTNKFTFICLDFI